jgi:uncharacterized protein (TIGR01777 family)
MASLFALLFVQIVLGAFDNLWHHEIRERLPAKRAAAPELVLHATRELLYALLFVALAWFEWHGLWAALVAATLLVEALVTLTDFVVEDRSRRLPALERILHTLLAINFGAIQSVFAPILWHWWHQPSAIVPLSHGAVSWLLSCLAVAVFAWFLRNMIAALRLSGPQTWVREPYLAGSSPSPRSILVSGATGFIGGHLVRRLIARGESVIVLTRDADRALDKFGPHVRIITRTTDLTAKTRIDAIVNLAGARILELPWTRRRRSTLLASRVQTTRTMVELMSRLEHPPRVLLSASAVGYYGIRGDEPVDEGGCPSAVFQSRLCQQWEAEADAAKALGARVVKLRMGLVLGNDGGALPTLARPFKLGLGAVLGSGRQWVSWIHIDDLVRLIEFALDTPTVRGILNGVAPVPVTHREMQRAIAAALERPLLLRIPEFALRACLGEMAQLLVDGQRVIPNRVVALGFRYRHPRITETLTSLLRRPAASAAPAQVLFNGECPVCRTEMDRYTRLCSAIEPGVTFIDSTHEPDALLACGLRREHLARRVYLCSPDGSVTSGMPALIALWARMPGYRALARLFSLPVLRQGAELLYDHVISSSLAAWAERRTRRRSGRPLHAMQKF